VHPRTNKLANNRGHAIVNVAGSDQTGVGSQPAAGLQAKGAVLLGIDHVGKRFGDGQIVALDDAKFEISDNEFFTLLGPSGCGKTTLLRIIAGFEHPTEGRVLLDGRDIGHEPPFKRPVNTMFQSYALFPHLNVRQNIAYGLEMLRWKPADIKRRVDEVLDLVQMPAFADRRTTQMSGGQQQRIALARALAPRPRVLLLDEPLSALDLKLRKAMQGELKRLQRETSLTFVMVTHDQEEALALSDRIAVMNKGKVLQVGTPEEIYARPKTCFVADFIGEANLIPAGLVGLADGKTISIRTEQISVRSRPADERRSVEAIVTALTFLGADTLIEARCAGDVPIKARVRGAVSGLSVGDRADFAWDHSSEWLLSE
jgi:spermidine/putrescine transport system ATP-binding protein